MGHLIGSLSTLSVNQRLALAMAVVLAPVGIALAVVGAWVIVAPWSWLARLNRRGLTRELVGWGADGVGGDPVEVDMLVRRFIQLNGWSLVGGGLGAVAGTGAVAGLALSATGSLANIMEFGQQSLFSAIIYQGLTLGLTLGYLVGTYAVTRVATGPAWADLRRRRVSDYRAGWLEWGMFVVAGLSFVTLAVIALWRKQIEVFFVGGYQTLPILPTAAIVALMAWTLLTPTIGALLCRWIATSPRALTSANPRAARAADEMRRARSIGQVLTYTWMSGAMTLESVASGALVPAPGLGGSAQLLLMLLGLLAFAFGMGLNALGGRLGGRITGWLSLRSLLAEGRSR